MQSGMQSMQRVCRVCRHEVRDHKSWYAGYAANPLFISILCLVLGIYKIQQGKRVPNNKVNFFMGLTS